MSIEAARALARCGSYGVTDTLVALVDQTDREDLAALAAESLGEMFEAHCPSRLHRLLLGNNYFMPHLRQEVKGRRLVRYVLSDCYAYANPFFYRRYLPLLSAWW